MASRRLINAEVLHHSVQARNLNFNSYLNFHCTLSLFVAVFLGCTSTGRVGLCFLWFFVQELSKAQPAVVLVLKRLRRRDNGLKSHPTDWEKPGIKPATPGLQDIGLSPTPRRLLYIVHYLSNLQYNLTLKLALYPYNNCSF